MDMALSLKSCRLWAQILEGSNPSRSDFSYFAFMSSSLSFVVSAPLLPFFKPFGWSGPHCPTFSLRLGHHILGLGAGGTFVAVHHLPHRLELHGACGRMNNGSLWGWVFFIECNTNLSMYLCIYESMYLSIYLPTYLSIYLSIYLSTYLSIYLSISI